MRSRIQKFSRHLLYALWSNILYGFIVYYTFMWLSEYSLLYAYLANLILIFSGLAIDGWIYTMLQSQKLVMQIKQERDAEKNYRIVQWILDSFVSFKAVLYVFYVVILIVSKIIEFNPALIGEDIGNFIRANDYSILFLLAFDTLIGQFSRDRERMRMISEKFRAALTENQD